MPKVYCCGDRDNDNVLSAAILANGCYEGVIFCRWTADVIGKNMKIDWEKFI